MWMGKHLKKGYSYYLQLLFHKRGEQEIFVGALMVILAVSHFGSEKVNTIQHYTELFGIVILLPAPKVGFFYVKYKKISFFEDIFP
jgi:hypothetical protein